MTVIAKDPEWEEIGDEILLVNQDEIINPPWVLPVIKASDPNFIKHVICEGSREHVISYLGKEFFPEKIEAVMKCSEPKCIINKESNDHE